MIDLERWDEIKEIVQSALDLPAEQQAGYLEEVCQGDEELRRQVEALLAVSATRADVYDNFVVMPPGVHAVDFKEGDEIGTYRIVRPLGTGGMSTVYLADDPRHERQVALKVLRAHRHRRREEQIAARFDHPNIVTFHDSGQVEAGPAYFVMEYIDGETITTYCETHRLSVKERLKLFLTVCDAVSYAHSNLVLHRDIKPANILVTKEGKPKLLDFGIAKSLSPSLSDMTATAPEDRALTVAFASPEQLVGETTSTATDIYSLGVLLCLMLTGRLPYAVKSAHELAMAIRNMEPTPPSQLVLKEAEPTDGDANPFPFGAFAPSRSRKLARILSGDLDAIVLRALRKEPEKRYQTVTEIAEDIRRYLAQEPVSARKGSRRYRAVKFFQRHRVGVSSAVISGGVILLLALGLFFQKQSAVRQRDQAIQATRRSEFVSRFLVDLFATANPDAKAFKAVTAAELLQKAARDLLGGQAYEPVLRAELLEVLGVAHLGAGDTSASLKLLRTALSLQESALTPRDPRLATTLQSLGRALTRAGDTPAAAVALQRALSIRRSAYGDESIPVADTLIRLGENESLWGKQDQAEKNYRLALQIIRRKAPDDKERLSEALNNLAVVCEETERYQESLSLHQESLDLRVAFYGRNHVRVARSLNNLANVYETMGQFSRAEPLYREALRIDRNAVPDDPSFIAVDLNNLGFLLEGQGRLNEAEPFLREAAHSIEIAHGLSYPLSIQMKTNYGRLLRKLGRYEEAKKELSESLEAATAVFPKGHWYPTNIRRLLAELLLDSGAVVEATATVEEVLATFREIIPEDRNRIATTEGLLGACLMQAGRLSEAEPLLLNAYSKGIVREQPEALERLIELYRRWDRPERRAEYETELADLQASLRR